MPEELAMMDINRAIDLLEDYTLDTPASRSQHYRQFHNALDNKVEMSSLVVNRLLAVCVHDLQKDKKYSLTVLRIINSILKRNKAGDFSTLSNLLPSLLEVLNILKTISLLNRMETLQTLCFETVLSYPDNVLIDLVTLHTEEVTEVFNSYCLDRINLEIRYMACKLLHKILQVLPMEQTTIFLTASLKVLFPKVVPTLVHCIQNEALSSEPLQTLEALTEILVGIDYSKDVNWEGVLESIYNPKKYPFLMKNMLEKGSKTWHRLWIVFIKLLKNQITRNNSPGGSPINSMLPVVEIAFKMDVTNRCRAFQCWDVLIESFHRETNETNISKMVKLLIVPLKSNNAKVEETALAKLNTWWHLIKSFQNRIDKFLDPILISFLHFCFGHRARVSKQPLVPCLLTENTKKKAVEAFIEIAGHLDCTGCVDLPKLNERIITKKVLVDNWNDWIFSLKVAISISTENIGVSHQQITCAWKSFVLVVSELPDNNVRKDLFHELLCILETMDEHEPTDDNRTELIFNMVMSLFGNEKIKALLKSKGEKEEPMHKIISVLMRPSLTIYYRSQRIKDVISKLKLITNYVVDSDICTPRNLIDWAFSNFSEDSLSFFWMALSETLIDLPNYSVEDLECILMWPLQSHSSITDIYLYMSYSSFLWFKLFESHYLELSSKVSKSIEAFLWSSGVTNSNLLFKLSGTLVILNHVLNDSDFEKTVELLMAVTNRVEDYKQIECICKLLTDTIASTLIKMKKMDKIKLEKNAMRCVKNIMKLIIKELQENNNLEKHALTLETLLSQLDAFFHQSKKIYCITIISDELLKLPQLLNNHYSLKKSLLATLKTCLLNMNGDNPVAPFDQIKTAIANIECNVEPVNTTTEKKLNENNFTTPDVKIVTRQVKKKETSIINTVVENGEEYIVVKSNWKFNPKKLTENQKEKLQRKREDIPALYQDLSQSQDEFKLTTWKTDSQDSSSTSSKSTSVNKASNVENVTNILKNIPSSDVVPKIIENIFSDNVKKDSVEDSTVKATTVSLDSLKPLSSPKDPKSPRIALKDRVFRNVRNLIEKSGVQKDKDLSESLTQIENIPKTPTSKVNNTPNIINSAPPKVSVDRPSRVKRKPKKYDDVELIALKRNRRSVSQSDSQPETNLEKTLPQSVLEKTSNEVDEDQCNNIDSDKQSEGLTRSSNDIVGDDLEVIDKKVVDNTKDNVKKVLPIEKADASEISSEMEVSIKVEKIETDENKQENEEIASSAKTELVTNEKNAGEKVKLGSIEENKEAVVILENTNESIKTPKSTKKLESANQKSSVKKSKKRRKEKELLIDTVEGHPFLEINTERRRVTRKNASSVNNSQGTSLSEELNKSKTNIITSSSNSKKKDKEQTSNESVTSKLVTVDDSQEKSQSYSDVTEEDFPLSEDIIESSQDSTFTTISTTSTKKSNKKLTAIVEKCQLKSFKNNFDVTGKQSQAVIELDNKSSTQQESDIFEKADDSDFPQNRAVSQKSDMDSTENMDTEPIDDESIELKDSSSDVIVINDDDEPPIVINTEDTCVGPETQEIADADTEPTDPNVFPDDDKITNHAIKKKYVNLNDVKKVIGENTKENTVAQPEAVNTDNDITKTICESLDVSSNAEKEEDTVYSPFKDDEQRKKDFLDNTLEISPIKTMSPVREKKSPSPEANSDYVVIKLTSPVQSNGEPFEKCDSPEIFTEEKISPDKRDLSPPREETNNINNNGSPSSSLSLKKNKPQMRSGRRAAQMLGLCVPDRLQTIINNERSEPEEHKKVSPSSTPARKNLRILYSSVGDNSENSEENEDSENFLKFKKSLPTSDCSPSGPILKRKLIEITDDATITPASKRKRVSFHDPPVSTTVAVQKYIEPCGIRSPQNSTQKRLERQNFRSQTVLTKSPKMLDNVFKLDSVLTKAVESFSDLDQINADDIQSMSLDETPAVEIIKNSDLNDIDPLCPELIDCMDPIDVIASDLSSPTMKLVFLKELEGKLTTIGDLAKMTELEVNRLCIKAPKVKIAKKVLTNYALKKAFDQTGPKEAIAVINVDDNETPELASDVKMDIETQTVGIVSKNMEMQTVASMSTPVSVQTDKIKTCHKDIQTIESGSKSTKDIIATCLGEKPDFIELLGSNLDKSSKLEIADTLPFEDFRNAFMKKVSVNDSKTLLSEIVEKHNEPNSQNRTGELSFLEDFVCERFESNDLILFCSKVLANIHAKTC